MGNINPKTLTYKSGYHTGAMIAFFLPPPVARAIALPGGESPEELHLTLAFLGKAADIEDPALLGETVSNFAATHGPVAGKIGGIGRFVGNPNDEGDAVYASFDSPDLPDFRHALVGNVESMGHCPVARTHGFTPHITLDYIPEDEAMPLHTIEPVEVTFDTISLVLAGNRLDFPLRGLVLRAGARNSRMDKKGIQKIHDTSCTLGAVCKREGAYTEKAGARNSRRDYRRIQQIHDLSVELDAACPGKAEAHPRKADILPPPAAIARYNDLIQMSRAIIGIPGRRSD